MSNEGRGDSAIERDGLPIGARRLSVLGWFGIVIIYLAIVVGVPYLSTAGMDVEYGTFPDVETVVRALIVPVGLSLVFVFLVIGVLGWWRPVFRDDKPVRKWVRIVPALLLITVLAGINYGGLSDKGLGFTLAFLFGALCVGFAEEGMFRGLGVVTFRSNGYSEGMVALWTCLVFGAAHATNLFTEGPSALLQVVVTIIAGYFFYLTRRVSGGLMVPAVLHGLWDFGLLSGAMDKDNLYAGTALFIVTNVVLAIVLLARRKHIELDDADRTPAGAGPPQPSEA